MGDAAPDSGLQQRQDGGHARIPAGALLIIPYFGTFGPWFPLYLHSLARQRTLDLLLVTDAPSPPLPPNARRVEMTFAEVRDLATAKLDTRVRLSTVRKLCDLKPAYGLVFEQYTRGYPYWAFGDEDVLYGDLDHLLAPHLQETLSAVSARRRGRSLPTWPYPPPSPAATG